MIIFPVIEAKEEIIEEENNNQIGCATLW